MREIDRSRSESVEEQIREFSRQELFEQLLRENQNLAGLGVRIPISLMALGSSKYGFLYEDRMNDKGGTKSTPMNFFMALVHSQPDLLKLPKDKFEKLGAVVSRIAMVTDVLAERTGEISWPEQFTQIPQLSPRKP